ncbi:MULTISPECIES: sensor domain-containing diguanylate cyclase [unclassified Neptuniibacter]|uniref:sensor domain-containing diguanylate cyclase n=1 Tax=unclassified Neptuniibacter TaxID=2630693 RepID=UPI000C46B1F6|nr:MULTISPECIES: sensor domain-containing diguanylate cyclase [unclassified Neptuniibacter]MAY40749.1 GGDEF domain-containing protein [Oceanospirillaceae bacterium]
MKFKQQMLVVVSLLIIVGFAVTASVSFYLSRESAVDMLVEHELPLTSDNIYAEVQRDLIKPRTVSSFMGNDTFLKDWILGGEQDIGAVTRYLREVKQKYGAFTAFMVSDLTRNYYHADGLLKQVSEEDLRDEWYFRVRQMRADNELNLDPDMAHGDELTIFINFKIRTSDGSFLGATGLGLNLASIKGILSDYRDRYGNNVYFVTPKGELLLHDRAGALSKNLHQEPGMAGIVEKLLTQEEGRFSYMRDGKTYLLNTRHIEELDLILCVEAEEGLVDKPLLTPVYVTLLVCFIVTGIVLLLLVKALNFYQGELESVAWQDPLTGLLNRRAFTERYERLKRSHSRKGRPLSLLMVDIDYFKLVNDQGGHALGDKVLQAISQLLSRNLRSEDYLGRWGGEEFILLLSETTHNEATEIAERIRKELELDAPVKELYAQGVTLSVGVATQQEVYDLDVHIKAADRALYNAKKEGRNCVRSA